MAHGGTCKHAVQAADLLTHIDALALAGGREQCLSMIFCTIIA